MFDLEDMWHYEESPEEKRRKKEAGQQSKKATESFIKLVGIFLFLIFLYSSSLLAAYFILKGTDFFIGLKNWEKVIAEIALAYLISSLVFFLKGIMMVLKAVGNWLWIVIWFICFAFVCLLPAVAIYFLLISILGPSVRSASEGISHYKFWSLVGAVIAGGIIYYKYGLNRDNALKVSYWAYRLGKQTGIALVGRRR